MSMRCPCGSELMIENCCISENIAAIKNKFINKLILPERIEWAATYIEYKIINNNNIAAEQNRYAESIGMKITCEEKCSMCCVQFIGARLEECDAIAVYLYLYPEVMNTFLINYNAWHARITSEDNILEKISDAYQTAFETRNFEDKKKYENLALEYGKKYARCPFLDDDKCLIYPIRPYACSMHCVLSDRKYCDPKLHEEGGGNQLKVKSVMNPLFFDMDIEYFTDLKGRYIFGALQSMVYNILIT